MEMEDGRAKSTSFSETKTMENGNVLTFGQCVRPSKPHWIHSDNYGMWTIELKTIHICKQGTSLE